MIFREEDSGEHIANAVKDLVARRITTVDPAIAPSMQQAQRYIVDPTVIDATAIRKTIGESFNPINEFPCVAPPFGEAVFGYISYPSEKGCIGLLHVVATEGDCDTIEAPCDMYATDDETRAVDRNAMAAAWSTVRWQLRVFVYIRKPGEGLFGPCTYNDVFIARDGTLIGITGQSLLAQAMEKAGLPMPEGVFTEEDAQVTYQGTLSVLFASLNFLNCQNIGLVEPSRPRHVARRIARTGVTVHTINVFPVGRSTGTTLGYAVGAGVPLTSVRGHFAHYGPDYNRGLLFGKYAGRFWIAQHGRGSAEFGEAQSDYRLIPE